MRYSKGDFDSIEEYNFFIRNPYLLPAQDTFYPSAFKDSDGIIFNAKPDFSYEDIFIEYKSHKLNNQANKSKADSDYKRQIEGKYSKSKNKTQLLYQWNHSSFKQGIVARKYSGRFLLVFKDKTELTTHAINKLIEQQVPWCYESEMKDRLLQMTGSNTLH